MQNTKFSRNTDKSGSTSLRRGGERLKYHHTKYNLYSSLISGPSGMVPGEGAYKKGIGG